MTCIKTGAIVHIPCYDLVFSADLFQVENAVVVRANGPLKRGENAFPLKRFCGRHQPTHNLLDSMAGNEFWRDDLGIFVVPQTRLVAHKPQEMAS